LTQIEDNTATTNTDLNVVDTNLLAVEGQLKNDLDPNLAAVLGQVQAIDSAFAVDRNPAMVTNYDKTELQLIETTECDVTTAVDKT